MRLAELVGVFCCEGIELSELSEGEVTPLKLESRTEMIEKKNRAARAMVICTSLMFSFGLLQVVMGYLANSLAVLADAAHGFVDVFSVLLNLWAARRAVSDISNTDKEISGPHSSEIFASFVSGLSLLGVTVALTVEACARLEGKHHAPIRGGVMFGIALAGLAVDLVCLAIMFPHQDGAELNVRSAWLHVVADVFRDFSVIAAAVFVLWAHWPAADSYCTLIVSGIILISGLLLVRDVALTWRRTVTEPLIVEHLPDNIVAYDVSHDPHPDLRKHSPRIDSIYLHPSTLPILDASPSTHYDI